MSVQFREGDKVQLIGGGEPMEVEASHGSFVWCLLITNEGLGRQLFRAADLEFAPHVKPEDD